jgi:hypothetical protein
MLYGNWCVIQGLHAPDDSGATPSMPRYISFHRLCPLRRQRLKYLKYEYYGEILIDVKLTTPPW